MMIMTLCHSDYDDRWTMVIGTAEDTVAQKVQKLFNVSAEMRDAEKCIWILNKILPEFMSSAGCVWEMEDDPHLFSIECKRAKDVTEQCDFLYERRFT